MDISSVPKAKQLRIARAHTLKEAIDRFNHELMDDEERQLLRDRVRQLRRTLDYGAP